MDEYNESTHEKKTTSRNEGHVNIRISRDIKIEAQHVLQQLGLDTSTAIHMFLRKVISYGGIPFELRLMEERNDTSIENKL